MKNIILTIFAIIGFATIVTGFTDIVNDSHQEIGRYQITATTSNVLVKWVMSNQKMHYKFQNYLPS